VGARRLGKVGRAFLQYSRQVALNQAVSSAGLCKVRSVVIHAILSLALPLDRGRSVPAQRCHV
jgi:hypothetical protein